jgi:hypothetical protein
MKPRSAPTLHFTLNQHIEALHMIRKGRVRWAAKGDPLVQLLFIDQMFGVVI